MPLVIVTAGLGPQATVIDAYERRGRRPAIGRELAVHGRRFRLVAIQRDANGVPTRAEYEPAE